MTEKPENFFTTRVTVEFTDAVRRQGRCPNDHWSG